MRLFFILLASFFITAVTSNSYAEDVVYTNPKLKANAEIKSAREPEVPDAISTAPAGPATIKTAPAIPRVPETVVNPKNTRITPLPNPSPNYIKNNNDKDDNNHNEHGHNDRNHVDYNDRVRERYRAPVIILDNGRQAGRRSSQTTCSSDGTVCITAYEYPENTIITAENKSPAANTLNIDYNLNNMVTKQGSQGQNIILKSGEIKNIEILEVTNPNYRYSYNYNFNAYPGVVDAVHDDDYVYDIPFGPKEKWMLYQGYGGKVSHNDRMNYYAYDFKMPEGTNVTAAREGIVVEVKDKFSEGGLNPELKDKANYIHIQHSDGTIGDYAHIKYQGALVSVGDYVQKDQRIALSGNTGYAANPHLHFAVLKTIKGGEFTSIPVKMKSSSGVSDSLKPGDYFQR